MVQKMVINVESSKPLSAYGGNCVLVYDNTKNQFYATTRESFLAPQNARIVELNQNFKDLQKEFNDYKKSMTDNYNTFIKNNQEFNKQVIAMVKEIYGEKGE